MRPISYRRYCFILWWFVCGFHVAVCNDYCSNGTVFNRMASKFRDNVTVGHLVYEYSDLLNGSLTFKETSVCLNTFKFDGNKVLLNKNLMEDCNSKSFLCNVDCSGVSNDLILERVFIPTGSLFFNKEEFSTSVTENTSPTPVFDFSNELNQTDCYPSINSGRLRIKNNDSGPFEIFDKHVKLKKGSQLDYESGKTRYTIQIEFTDDLRNASTKLVVNVIDVDDMDPVFNTSRYCYEIDEERVNTNWQPTYPKVSAHDKDFGDGRQNLSFYFQDGSYDKAYFDINNVDGSIKVLKPLDRETHPEHNLILKVQQDNNPSRSATASLLIKVKDINDNLPFFKDDFEEVHIDEHASFGTFLCKLSSIDYDSKPFDKTGYLLKTFSDIFYAETNEDGYGDGEVRVNNSTALDRETLGNVINVTVTAVDATNNTEGGNMILQIHIIDINDNSPIFTQPKGYTFSGKTTGTIGQVNATDDDSNRNGLIMYKIPSHHGNLRLDENTGVVNLTDPISDDITFHVEACDSPVQQSSRRCSQVPVTILANLTDTLQKELNATISENVRPKTIVKFIDMGERKTYKMIGENSSFEVGATSGVVSTLANIDREDGHDSYTLNIHVLTNRNFVFANITLTIYVLDVNDNPPVYNTIDNFFELPYPLTPGTDIGYVTATDKDDADNGAIQYIIPETITSRYFTINETTGNISLSDVILPHGKEFFQLIIIARDKGNPPLQSSCNVYISRTLITDLFVRIEAPLESNVLKAQHLEYETKLSELLSLMVKIEAIHPKVMTGTARKDVSQPRSLLDISAKNLTGTYLPNEELQRIVLRNMEGIQLLFLQETTPTVSEDSKFTASQIGLVVLAAIILVGGILATIFIFRKKKRSLDENSVSSLDEEKAPINNDVNAVKDTVSMVSIEVTVELGEERERTSDYDSSQNSNEQAISESNALGTINPAFQNDTETLDMTEVNAISTTDEAEQQLNQLNELLNMEENKASLTEYHIEDTVTDSKDVKNLDEDNDPNVSNGSGPDLYPPKADYISINNIRSENEQLNENEYLAVHEEIKDALNDSSSLPQADYENNANETPIEGNNDQVLDQESGEFIMSPDKVDDPDIDYNTSKVTQSDENSVDVQDEEPDIDYNEKQVRFSTVVLDSEENKFEPLKADVDDQSDVLSNENETPEDSVDGEEQTTENETINFETDLNENDKSSLLSEEETTAF
ncbi:protocadherin Fat 3-like [Mytilus edulis]|uniref:protocadherin Fat 3-like n=1 Tax=Mytilus edulis TaxID=6550 RepID=UPI0039F0FD31